MIFILVCVWIYTLECKYSLLFITLVGLFASQDVWLCIKWDKECIEKFDIHPMSSFYFVQKIGYLRAKNRCPQMPSVLCTTVRCGKYSNTIADRNIYSQAIMLHSMWEKWCLISFQSPFLREALLTFHRPLRLQNLLWDNLIHSHGFIHYLSEHTQSSLTISVWTFQKSKPGMTKRKSPTVPICSHPCHHKRKTMSLFQGCQSQEMIAMSINCAYKKP